VPNASNAMGGAPQEYVHTYSTPRLGTRQGEKYVVFLFDLVPGLARQGAQCRTPQTQHSTPRLETRQGLGLGLYTYIYIYIYIYLYIYIYICIYIYIDIDINKNT